MRVSIRLDSDTTGMRPIEFEADFHDNQDLAHGIVRRAVVELARLLQEEMRT